MIKSIESQQWLNSVVYRLGQCAQIVRPMKTGVQQENTIRKGPAIDADPVEARRVRDAFDGPRSTGSVQPLRGRLQAKIARPSGGTGCGLDQTPVRAA